MWLCCSQSKYENGFKIAWGMSVLMLSLRVQMTWWKKRRWLRHRPSWWPGCGLRNVPLRLQSKLQFALTGVENAEQNQIGSWSHYFSQLCSSSLCTTESTQQLGYDCLTALHACLQTPFIVHSTARSIHELESRAHVALNLMLQFMYSHLSSSFR